MDGPISLPPGLLIAAPRSGAGKTTVTLGLLGALKRRGVAVQSFKCGPDYIDPAFHAAATGRPSFNIDSWAMRIETAAAILARETAHADLVIAEGLMGLFDGVATAGHWGNGASADLAAATGWPVILVVDITGQSQTAAATALGFARYRPGVSIAGVLLNRSGSERHARLAASGFERAGITVFGILPRAPNLELPERHLGLVQAEETADLSTRLDNLASFVEKHASLDSILTAARPGTLAAQHKKPLRPPPGQRIALARDAAFSFVYPHVLAGWREAGAEIIPFSPLDDEVPHATADVVWLPGGYPELHAGKLAGAARFKAGLSQFAESKPVHGECGGYMALGTGLVDADGHRHEMLGLLGLETSFASRKMHLGYRRARLLEQSCLGDAGAALTGHEFHYATVVSSADPPLFSVENADGEPIAGAGGSVRGTVSGSFFHVVDW